MRLTGSVTVLLAEEARGIVEQLLGSQSGNMVMQADVVESEDLGLWVLTYRDGVPRNMLLRWEYILAIEKPAEVGSIFGVSGGKDLG